jgi:hypothetical protein
MNQKTVKWTCPHCNNLHYYYWDEYDIFEGEVNMNCDSCRRNSKQMMYIDSISGNAWCEHMKENDMSELETLKKKAERIQKRIQELEEEKKKNEYKSLHNVIAKWEFYYSEKIEKMVHSRDTLTITFRDTVSEEIENLLKSIDEWIDKELSFNQTAYTAEYFVGWDECRKTLKKKLRSDSDFYGKTK